MSRRRPYRFILWIVLSTLAVGCTSDGGRTARTGSPTTVATTTTAGSIGCGRPVTWPELAVDGPGDVARSTTVDGTERTYRIGIPDDIDPDEPVPLVVNLHGSGSNAFQASVYSDLPRRAAKRGWVTVTPDAIDGKWELGAQGADADFLGALVDEVTSHLCIAEDRIHLIGMSLGAWKAASTACSDDRYASIVLVAVEVFPGECRPLGVLAFHGTADPVVAYGPGGGTVDDAATPNAGLPGALTNIAAWAANADCRPRPAVTRVGDDVVVRRYQGCTTGTDVELDTIVGGGHTWPGSAISLGDPSLTTHTIDATSMALDFFAAHPRS